MSETVLNVILVILIVVALAANVWMRRRRSESSPLGRVASIFYDVNSNLKRVEKFGIRKQLKKFKAGAWQRNQDKVEFLSQELRNTLANAFQMTTNFNQQIDSAKKYGSSSYMAGINVDTLREPLTKSKQGLQGWIKENFNNPEYAPRRRGLFG